MEFPASTVAATLPTTNFGTTLASAMSADELPSPPRKTSRKRWAVALTCVVAVTMVVLLATPPKPEPVKVWFVRATNEGGVKKLVFEGTNGLTNRITYYAYLSPRSKRYVTTPGAWAPYYDLASGGKGPGESFTFTLKAPPKDVPYYVKWSFDDNPWHTTRSGGFRMACYNFLLTHGKFRLAEHFKPKVDFHYIPSSEIKE